RAPRPRSPPISSAARSRRTRWPPSRGWLLPAARAWRRACWGSRWPAPRCRSGEAMTDLSRRIFLKGAGLAAVGVGFHPSSLLVRAAEAAGPGSQVLVQVFLRGGADGLNQVVPFGDPDYYDLRGEIALPRPGQSGGVTNLDGYFGLPPDLAVLLPLWQEGRLAFVPAVGNYALSRSHFDAQDF